jgi:hypothetical protein
MADGLLLVLACGTGFGAMKGALPPDVTPLMLLEGIIRSSAGTWTPALIGATFAELSGYVLVPFLAAWTPFCLAIQLRQPRTRWRRQLRGPGLMACLVASAAIASFVPSAFGLGPVPNHPELIYRCCSLASLVAGLAVLCCWGTMAICGILRPRRHWADRLGRLTGACWVVTGVAGFTAVLLGWP